MSPKAERRVNLPLRGRCRRQKGCISNGRSPVLRILLPMAALPPTGGNKSHRREAAIPQPSGRRPVKLRTLRTFGPPGPSTLTPQACPMAIPPPSAAKGGCRPLSTANITLCPKGKAPSPAERTSTFSTFPLSHCPTSPLFPYLPHFTIVL